MEVYLHFSKLRQSIHTVKATCITDTKVFLIKERNTECQKPLFINNRHTGFHNGFFSATLNKKILSY